MIGALRLGLVTAWLEPPRAVGAGERPRASALARMQARDRRPVTSLFHTVVMLDDAGAQLLDLLDGTRDAEAVRTALREAVGVDLAPEALDANLRALAAAGLLEGDGPS
jgi:Arc/MetJ family transcription regulator